MPGSDEILIFANPIAGRGRGQGIARRLEARLHADGYAVHLLLKRPDALTPQDFPAGAKAAVVIGGDGTLRSVANRLCGPCGDSSGVGAEAAVVRQAPTADTHGPSARPGSQTPAPSASPVTAKSAPSTPAPSAPPIAHDGRLAAGPPLLVVPLGTANLMGRHLGIRWKDATLEDQVSAAVAGGRVVSLDAGRVNGRLFLLMVGVGFDAAVVHELDRVRRGPIAMLSYVLPAALALTNYQYPPLTVEVDGRRVFGPVPAVAFVGNVREYGTGFPLLPDATPDDGLLDVCVLPCRSPVDLAGHFIHSMTGDHLHTDGVVYLKGRHVRIDSPEPVPVQVDGDALGHTPVIADLLPVRLPFIVPAESGSLSPVLRGEG